ncbi:dihydrolipoyl dehydrogenase family protein [Marisediminicola sp. LYQ85]|uniref:dihydrolipoyl dehydrogenase family protein n=1 Tax=Marisediminicola sp. LYQ85 TaxID=3391062 RepID=UPI003982EC87
MDATEPWDLVVLGGGTAGLVASRAAAAEGRRVLLVEAHRLGGDCLNTGCVPSKALIAASLAAATARTSAALGVRSPEVVIDFAKVMGHVRQAIALIEPDDSRESLERAGVVVMEGRARFTGPGELEVEGARIRFARAIIATGASPAALPGLTDRADADADDDDVVLTSESFWSLTELPERLLVIGGGAVGCELAGAMARLGSAVTLVHRGDRLLPRDDARAAEIVRAALAADGVDVRLATTVTDVDGATVTLEIGDSGAAAVEAVTADRILVAVGRAPNTAALGLEVVGVELDSRGFVRVDDTMRTTNPAIWAAGDVTGRPQLTHIANVDGRVAAANAATGERRSNAHGVVPRVTFTRPEVAAVGIRCDDAETHGFDVVTVDHRDLDRAVCEADVGGYTSIVVDGSGRVRGATIVGPRAGESLGEACLAVRLGVTTADLASATHPYPTYSDGVWKAARIHAGSRGGVRSTS